VSGCEQEDLNVIGSLVFPRVLSKTYIRKYMYQPMMNVNVMVVEVKFFDERRSLSSPLASCLLSNITIYYLSPMCPDSLSDVSQVNRVINT
jgi:hypothetical protein